MKKYPFLNLLYTFNIGSLKEFLDNYRNYIIEKRFIRETNEIANSTIFGFWPKFLKNREKKEDLASLWLTNSLFYFKKEQMNIKEKI